MRVETKMNEIEEIEGIEEEITEKEIQKQEIKELTEEIQSDNKEIYDIMKTDLYKTLFQVLSRVTLKIEITNLDKISSVPIQEEIKKSSAKEEGSSNFDKTSDSEKSKSSGKKSKITKKEKIESIDYAIIKDYSEKSYKLYNKQGLITYVPKSVVEKYDDDKIYLTEKAKNWFKPEWQEDN